MKRIAVVEDEVYMREELCNMLQKDGYLAEAITELEDAVRLLAALRPDLVILDLNLPEISGFQICQELKNKTAIPVLVLTSRDQVKDELQAFHLGADEYLTKPCRKDRLLARVSNILKRYEGRTNLIEGLDFLLDQQTYTLYIHNTSVVLPKNQGNFPEEIKLRLETTARMAYELDEEMRKIRDDIRDAQLLFDPINRTLKDSVGNSDDTDEDLFG